MWNFLLFFIYFYFTFLYFLLIFLIFISICRNFFIFSFMYYFYFWLPYLIFLFPIFVIVYLKLSFTYLITSLSFYKMIVPHICSITNICYVFFYTFHRDFRQKIYDMLIYIFFKKHTPYVLLPCYENFGMVISILLSII